MPKRRREEFHVYSPGAEAPRDVTHALVPGSVQVVLLRFFEGDMGEDCQGAFEDCHQLEEVTFEEGVLDIEDDAFCNCTSLGRFRLPSTLLKIGSVAFGRTSVTEVHFPDGLNEIGDGVFEECPSLESVRLPSTLAVISPEAFFFCTSLKVVTLPVGIRSIKGCAFQDCTSLETIVFPPTMNAIGRAAFHGCSSLRTVELPEGVILKIQDDAFDSCNLLDCLRVTSSALVVTKNVVSNTTTTTTCRIGVDGLPHASERAVTVTGPKAAPVTESGKGHTFLFWKEMVQFLQLVLIEW